MKLLTPGGLYLGGLLVGMLSPGVLTVACSSDDTDEHHEDASSDATGEAAPQDDGGSDASGDATGDSSPDGAQSTCVPACTSTQVCCVDQHAHFPRCVDGAECVPPLQRPDGG